MLTDTSQRIAPYAHDLLGLSDDADTGPPFRNVLDPPPNPPIHRTPRRTSR
ncbi:MAG: hypothetical protein HYR62_00835 [Actinobacteria bacterium]|nr:hypothetical protein [Actinomycetota bacterium]